VTDVRHPHEGSSINLPQEAELNKNAYFRNYIRHSGHLEVPTADSPSEEVKTGNVDGEPPNPPESHPETTPEPMAVDSPTDSLVPAPDSEAGVGGSPEASEKTQAISVTAEVCLC